MILRRSVVALIGAVLISLLATHARAQDEPVLVMVQVEPGGEALAGRVSAELRALGFDVQTSVVVESSTRELEDTARAAHAAAAIRIVRSDKKAEVWVADRVTGKTLLRELEVGKNEDPDGVLAVRAVELLRASLLEVDAGHPSRGEVRPAPVVREVVKSSHAEHKPSVALAIGFGPQLMPALSASLHAFVGVALMPSRVGIEGWGLIPILNGQLCAAQGCARVTSGLFAIGGRVALTPDSARVHPELGAGFGGAFLHAEATATPPYSATAVDTTVAIAYLRAALMFSLSTHFRLGFDALVGSALPPTPIQFAGQDVAHWGGPFVSIFLRAEVWL